MGVASVFPLLCEFPCSPHRLRLRHQVYDRGVRDVMSGRWAEQCGAASEPTADRSQASSALFECHSLSFCSAHDSHNALKWGHFMSFGSPQTMENVYGGVAGFRYCSGQSMEYMAAWLGQVLAGRSADSLPSSDTLSSLWTLLGASPDVVEELSCNMRLHWDGSKLCVQESFLEEPECLSHLSTTLLALWSFSPFSSSRWLTTGSSC